MSSALIRSASLTHYVEVAQSVGLDPYRMLADVELNVRALSEPDLQIPVERVGLLLERSAQASGVEAFGLRMAESRQLSNLGAVGMLIRDQRTLRDSIGLLVRYLSTLNGAMSMMLEEVDGIAIIREEVSTRRGTGARQGIELGIGVLVTLMRRFLGAHWQPRRVCFVHAAPRDLSAHLRILGPCIDFNHEFNGVIFASAELDAVNAHADPAMARYAQQLLDAMPQSRAPSIQEDIRRVALLLLPSGRCSIEQVAQHLGLVCRTVQRRLADEGTSFSDLINQLRVELAERYVTGGERALTDVAALLGFSAPSGFSRWYQAQFGCSPSQARARAREGAEEPSRAHG
ncbi:MAG: AraC family transcriptional regulator [Paucibacter sp.]|nr:AraC family transcriptional regulator [Roseateles sp.]